MSSIKSKGSATPNKTLKPKRESEASELKISLPHAIRRDFGSTSGTEAHFLKSGNVAAKAATHKNCW
jgi:hypothetical protein